MDVRMAAINAAAKMWPRHEISLFRTALTDYVFNRNANISTVGMGGQITGTYHRESFMALTQSGERIEKILLFPVSTPSGRRGGVAPRQPAARCTKSRRRWMADRFSAPMACGYRCSISRVLVRTQ